MSELRELISRNPIVRISYTGLMIAFVFLTTVVFSLYIPATQGFFNIGESGVYIAAVTGGAVVGGIAGGIGSMFADLYLGYAVYAPATLIIKAVEGFIVGYLSKRLEKIFTGGIRRILGVLIGFILGIGIMSLGNIFYIGEAEASILNPSSTLKFYLTSMIWYVIGLIFILIVVILGYLYPEELGIIVAMAIGGSEMVIGYFLYENIILGVAAYVEIPYNVMQMMIGMLITLMVYSGLKSVYK